MVNTIWVSMYCSCVLFVWVVRVYCSTCIVRVYMLAGIVRVYCSTPIVRVYCLRSNGLCFEVNRNAFPKWTNQTRLSLYGLPICLRSMVCLYVYVVLLMSNGLCSNWLACSDNT